MVDIVECGAEKGQLCTAAIQAAIDAMTQQGWAGYDSRWYLDFRDH